MEADREREPTAEEPRTAEPTAEEPRAAEPAAAGSPDDIWTYPDTVGRLDLAGFKVEAADGDMGKVQETSHDGGYLVIATGTRFFGKKVLLPAGVIDRIDRDGERVYVDRTKREIEGAPEYDEERLGDGDYRESVGGYYTARGNRSDVPG